MSDFFVNEPFSNMSIFFGIILIFVGILFKVKPPKTINSIYGYRTPRSMKDQAHWDFAHQYSASLSIYLGLACMALSPIGMYLEFSEVIEALLGAGIMIVVCIMLFWRTENALKEKFGE